MDRRNFLKQALEASTVMVGAMVIPFPKVLVPEERKVVIAHEMPTQELAVGEVDEHRFWLSPDRPVVTMPFLVRRHTGVTIRAMFYPEKEIPAAVYIHLRQERVA